MLKKSLILNGSLRRGNTHNVLSIFLDYIVGEIEIVSDNVSSVVPAPQENVR